MNVNQSGLEKELNSLAVKNANQGLERSKAQLDKAKAPTGSVAVAAKSSTIPDSATLLLGMFKLKLEQLLGQLYRKCNDCHGRHGGMCPNPKKPK